MLGHLARVVLRHQWLVVGVWIALTVLGVVVAPLAVNRMLTTFSIPGSKTYQANQQIVQTFHNGDQPPLVVVLQDPSGDVTRVAGAKRTLTAALRVNPGARQSSFFSTHSPLYVSKDHHSMFAEIYPSGRERVRVGWHGRSDPACRVGDRARRCARLCDRQHAPSTGGRKRWQWGPEHPG